MDHSPALAGVGGVVHFDTTEQPALLTFTANGINPPIGGDHRREGAALTNQVRPWLPAEMRSAGVELLDPLKRNIEQHRSANGIDDSIMVCQGGHTVTPLAHRRH